MNFHFLPRAVAAAAGIIFFAGAWAARSPAQTGAVANNQAAATNAAEVEIAAAIRAANAPVSVVHFWAPWCPNCLAEMKNGAWSDFVAKNPGTHFYFVALWNGGEDGRAALTKAGIGEQGNVTILADPNPSRDRATKTSQFLGQPLTWIPTTWVFKGGKQYYALNYGEVRFPMLQQMLDDATADWSHK